MLSDIQLYLLICHNVVFYKMHNMSSWQQFTTGILYVHEIPVKPNIDQSVIQCFTVIQPGTTVVQSLNTSATVSD